MAEFRCNECNSLYILPVISEYSPTAELYCHRCKIAWTTSDLEAWARFYAAVCRLLEEERKR